MKNFLFDIDSLKIKHHDRRQDIHKAKSKVLPCKSTRLSILSSSYLSFRFDSESIATITDLPVPCNKSDVEAFLDDLFDRALDPKNLGKKKTKAALLSTLDQRRLQMISNSSVDPSSRRRGLTNFLHKNSSQKKSSIRSSSINEQKGSKKKIKTEKNVSERKKRTKPKKKQRQEQLNTNNNNAMVTDNSLMSFSSGNGFVLPQVGYTSRAETDETSEHTKYVRGPRYQAAHRQSKRSKRLSANSSHVSEKKF